MGWAAHSAGWAGSAVSVCLRCVRFSVADGKLGFDVRVRLMPGLIDVLVIDPRRGDRHRIYVGG